ncbi:MAG: hypothetical protein NVS3B5_07830 [Sphingomicrobium sp.]
MAAMVTACAAFAPWIRTLFNKPWRAGLLAGLLMRENIYWVVRPLGCPAMALPAAWNEMSSGTIA